MVPAPVDGDPEVDNGVVVSVDGPWSGDVESEPLTVSAAGEAPHAASKAVIVIIHRAVICWQVTPKPRLPVWRFPTRQSTPP